MEMDKQLALNALKKLDAKMAAANTGKVILVIGGGGSMILQHGYDGGTVDIDAAPVNIDFEELKPYMLEVSKELGIAADWLNPYYQAFTVYLPKDTKSRMGVTYSGVVLTVKSLGAEDVLIMKLMAGRAKDMGHIKHLLRMKIDIRIVEKRLEELLKLFPKEAEKALDRLDDLTNK